MDSNTKKAIIAIIERHWKNGHLIPLAKELLENGNIDKYLDKEFIDKYNKGEYNKKYSLSK